MRVVSLTNTLVSQLTGSTLALQQTLFICFFCTFFARRGVWMAVWSTSQTIASLGVGGDWEVLSAVSRNNGLTWSSPVPVMTNVRTVSYLFHQSSLHHFSIMPESIVMLVLSRLFIRL